VLLLALGGGGYWLQQNGQLQAAWGEIRQYAEAYTKPSDKPAATPASTQFDFISVIAHELGHGLGFTSSSREDGAYGISTARSAAMSSSTPARPSWAQEPSAGA